MRHKALLSGLVTLLISVIMAPVAQAEMYVGGYAGFVRSATVFRDYLVLTTHHPAQGTFERHQTRGTFNPSIIGGLKVGAWFNDQGALGGSYPDWMKYVGLYFDFSYHPQNFKSREGNTIIANDLARARNLFKSAGSTTTFAVMLAARYGFCGDKDVPFGRLQPYLGVGPAVIFTTQKISLSSRALIGGALVPYMINPESDTDVTPALAIEPGLKWMVSKNLGLDFSFKFRWAHPSFTFHYIDPFSATPESMTLHPQYLILSFQVGAAYHF